MKKKITQSQIKVERKNKLFDIFTILLNPQASFINDKL